VPQGTNVLNFIFLSKLNVTLVGHFMHYRGHPALCNFLFSQKITFRLFENSLQFYILMVPGVKGLRIVPFAEHNFRHGKKISKPKFTLESSEYKKSGI